MAYRPYRSDSDVSSGSGSGTDSGTESDVSFTTDTTTSEYSRVAAPLAVPNFRALAQGLTMTNMGGGNTFDASGNRKIPDSLPGFNLTVGHPTFKNYELDKDPSGEEMKASEKSVNSIIMLDSRNRDRNIFVQPTNVTLRLPRVYSNVTSFQLVQVKLLSAFYYFRAAKANTSITIEELNRVVVEDGTVLPNVITSFIREGTYNIASLLSELTTRLNVTPVFYDFPNGFQDFAPRFAATGDYSIGFNYPGDNYYDSLLDQYIPNPTTALIISKYFQGQYAGRSSYSTDQIKIAYYYPVLKEYVLDQRYIAANPLNLELAVSTPYLQPGETVYSRIVYTFQGIDDPVILEVIINNSSALDTYRVKHTFRYALINKYTVSYEAQSNKVTIASPSLNTSLLTLINFKQAQSFAEQLNFNEIDQATFNNFNTQNTILLAVLNDMFYTIQRWMAVYFGINFNTYTLDYIANPTYPLPLRDGYQAVGISSNFDSNVIYRNLPVTTTNILAPLQQSAPQYWNRMTGLPESTIAFPYNLETGNPATSSNYPYSILLQQQDEFHNYVDVSGYLYVNQRDRYADMVIPIEASKYTVLRFKSPVRQTLQVETLSRPTEFRYPAYNAVTYDLSAQKLFDNSYCFVENAQNTKMDINAGFQVNNIKIVPGFETNFGNFGLSYTSSFAQWGSTFQKIQVGDTRKFFQIEAPFPPGYTSTLAPGYRYPMAFTLAASTTQFVTPMNMYLYHDRGAFMADISGNRKEKPINYLTSISTGVEQSTATLTFPVYANQTYYVLARSIDTSIASQNFRVVPWFPEGSNYTALTSTLSNFDPLANPATSQALSNYNYAVNADPAYIRLPIQQSIQTFAIQDPLALNLTFSTAAMGYDVNGVSTDLTDYSGFVSGDPLQGGNPAAKIRVDPITGYIFQVDTGYDSPAQQYITATSGNSILQPQGLGVYNPGAITGRDHTKVHWYGTTYMANSENQAPMTSNLIASSNNIAPFTNTTTNVPLQGYTYGGSNNSIQFGDGIFGISFIPDQGVWDIQRMMFKSVYTTDDPETDGNLNIEYVGVFPSELTTNRFVHEIPLSEALAVLKFSKSVTYTSNSLNLGFDPAGGTYYEFVRDTSFQTGSNSYLYGYSQIRQKVDFDIHSIYSFFPFTASRRFTTFDGIVGSPVPYPYYSDASGALSYYDGSTPLSGNGIVVPTVKASPDVTRGPPAGYDQTQSVYEQSPPIGTNLLQYIEPYPFALLSNTMKPWDPLPYAPSLVIADVSGYILTQDSFYRVFQYASDTNDQSLREKYQFTLDQVYSPNDSNINFIGAAANESEYAFFAYSNLTPSVEMSNKLLIRTMDPHDGAIRATYEMINVPGFNPTAQEITTVTYNNFGGFTLGLKSASTITAICKHSATTSTMTLVTALDLPGYNANVNRFITRQTPKEEYGSFYIFPYRTSLGGPIPTGITDYALVTPSNILVQPNTFYKYNSYSGQQDTWSSNYPTQIQVINLSTTSNIAVFKEPIVSRQPFKDYLYMLSDTDMKRFYQVTGFTNATDQIFTSNASITTSLYEFPVNTSNFTQGANGAKWSLVGNTLYGNRNDVIDSPRKIYQAWQLFYPLMRITFRQIAKNFSFMTNYDGLQYPEYPHTCIVGYDSYPKMVADISGRWGLESSSNFVVGDFDFRASAFKSFLFTFPLQPSTPQNPYYYLAIRGYSPTEKSQVLLRTSLTNKYDYGYNTLGDLSGEVPLLQTQSNLFNPNYFNSLSNFNSNFIIGSNGQLFGANVIQGYAGSNLSNIASFGEFYAKFVSLYNQYNAQVQLVQKINSNVNAYVTNFIQTDLQNILPASALNRQRFTDPLTFTIMWKSALLPQFSKLIEEWGMGWNLGFDKADTSYQTVHVGQSFFKILDDFINLQMNREFDMNRMDIGGPENLAATQEPTGFTKAFHGKLLLAPFGSYAQTLVSNPISFYPPLGRMDRLTFTWVDVTGATINNADCEWNAVVQIAETKNMTEIVPEPRFDPSARTKKK